MHRASHIPAKQPPEPGRPLWRTAALYAVSAAALAGAAYVGYRFLYIPWRNGTLAEQFGWQDTAEAAPPAADAAPAPVDGGASVPLLPPAAPPAAPRASGIGLASLTK